MKNEKASHGVIKSAARVLEVLELFAQKRAPLSVKEVAARNNYPLSSTAVLIRSMAALGYLRYDRTLRAYLPTTRVAEIGEWIYGAEARRRDLVTLATDLAEATGKVAIIARANDIYAHYIHVYQRHNRVRNLVPEGSRRLLCRSATGWAMLAERPENEVRAIVKRTHRQFGDVVREISFDWLMIQLRETRRQGYAISRGMVVNDITVVAMPLPTRLFGSPLAIGISATSRRMERDLDDVIDAMENALNQVTEKP